MKGDRIGNLQRTDSFNRAAPVRKRPACNLRNHRWRYTKPGRNGVSFAPLGLGPHARRETRAYALVYVSIAPPGANMSVHSRSERRTSSTDRVPMPEHQYRPDSNRD